MAAAATGGTANAGDAEGGQGDGDDDDDDDDDEAAPVVTEEYISHAMVDVNEVAQHEYRLVSGDVCHMCVDGAVAVLYHSAQNSTYYLAEEEVRRCY